VVEVAVYDFLNLLTRKSECRGAESDGMNMLSSEDGPRLSPGVKEGSVNSAFSAVARWSGLSIVDNFDECAIVRVST
jgi:hypothetical protein